MQPVDFSIVIPAFNESHRLPQTLEEIRPYLDSKGFIYEVLVVDDGSSDNTVALCQEAAKHWKELRCIAKAHEGKGAAVKEGCLKAGGNYVLIMDADHPTPIDTLNFLLPFAAKYDMVVGVRNFSGEEGSSGRFRRIIGLMQQLLAHIVVFRKSVADSQCGFKLLSRLAAQKIFSRTQIKGGMYDVEMFLIAQIHNLKIYSKSVRWVNKEGSTINILKCVIFDPFSLIGIRMYEFLGRYR